MATISRLSVSLTANTSGLQRGLKKAGGIVKGFASRIFSLKSAIVGALGVGSLGALAASSVAAFRVQEQAVAALDSSIKSMGRTTKDLSKDLQSLASRIQQEGVLGDEAILEGVSFLTTYKEISDDLLPRVTRVMADLAAKMGGSTVRAANLLGKASMGLTGTLALAGISLSDAAKESKDFELILSEIEQQVGGLNKSLGDTASAAFTQFSNAIGDVKEGLGGIIAVAIGPFLRLISQELGQTSINVQILGERFRDWIVEAVKGATLLADAWLGVKAAFDFIGAAVDGILSTMAGAAHVIASTVNSFMSEIGLGAVFTADQFTFLEQQMDRTQQNMRENIDQAFAGIDRLTGDPNLLPSVQLKAEIDELAIAAGVAEMKQRLGLAGGPNYRTEPIADKLLNQRVLKNPQIDATNDILSGIRQDIRSSSGGLAFAG